MHVQKYLIKTKIIHNFHKNLRNLRFGSYAAIGFAQYFKSNMSHYDINSNNLNNGSIKVNGLTNGLKNSDNANTILESVFDQACGAIQNLPKNGNNL